jgi:CheY-like chemotaxis protein
LLFQPFQQADAGRKAGGGSGLGLSISQRLVHLMGGHIHLESALGQGTRFHCSLPFQQSIPHSDASLTGLKTDIYQHLHPAQTAVRILVVDDLSDNRILLRELLQPAGFLVSEAIHGADALAQIAQQQPHAVLMDMRMPIMDGYEATRRLKSQRTTAEAPRVIAVTASTLAEDRKAIFECGADALLQKPIEALALFETLTEELNLRWLPPPSTSLATRAEPPLGSIPATYPLLPTTAHLALQQALNHGDMTTFETMLTKLGSEHTAQVQHLLHLAHHFDYDALHLWLDQQSLKGRSTS